GWVARRRTVQPDQHARWFFSWSSPQRENTFRPVGGPVRRWVLQQRQAVADDQAVLVRIGGGGHVAAQARVAPGEAQAFQRALLQGVVQAEIAFPLLAIAQGTALDVVPGKGGHARLQARNAGAGEVISVLGQPGALAGGEELADLAVGDQVGGGAVTLVEEGEGAVARNLLVAATQRVAAQAVGEQRTPGAVVDLAVETRLAGAGITLGATGGVAVLAVGTAVEVAQVGFQAAYRQGQVMHQSEEVLLVVVVQVAVVVLRGQVLGDLVVTTGEVELVGVGPGGRTADTQADVIGRRAGL